MEEQVDSHRWFTAYFSLSSSEFENNCLDKEDIQDFADGVRVLDPLSMRACAPKEPSADESASC